MNLYDAAKEGNLERVQLLVEQGAEKDETFGDRQETALCVAAEKGHLDIIRYLVEQGSDIEKPDSYDWTPLINLSFSGHLEVARYLLEQGANRDKTIHCGWTSLHLAANYGHLEITKLLMVYGADLNARDNDGLMPIDMPGATEEIKQAIRDEPRRRMDHGHKRATEQDRHPNTATSASTEQEEEDEQSNKKPCLGDGEVVVEGKVAEEDEPSEPSDEEDGGY